jgi:hypothetical protein
MINYGIDEKIWTIEELESNVDFDTVRCVECELLLGIKSGGVRDHSKKHDKFYKYDQEKENELVKIRKEEAEVKANEVEISEEGKVELKKKLDELKKSTEHKKIIYLSIVVGFSALLQMKISKNDHPCTVLFNGNATNKEIIINLFKKLSEVIHVDSFTPKSFVTHSARHSTKDLKYIDLLPKIHNKGMLTSNTDSIFLGNKPTVNDNIRMLDTVLEGNGYESHSAVHGTRGYAGNYNFVWLGTINQINKRVSEAINMMNNKPLFFKLDGNQEPNMKEMMQSLSQTQDSQSNRLINAVESFWVTISKLFSDDKKRIKWNKSKDDEKTCKNIINLSIFLSDFRAHLPTTNTEESTSGGTNYNFGTSIKEDINKLFKTLYNLAQGHAIIHGRNYITSVDLEIIVHIVMSSIPEDRLNLFEILYSKDIIKTEQIESYLSVSKATTLKEMEKLRVLGIVEIFKVNGKSKPTLSIQLKEKYDWVLDDTFKIYLKDIIHIHTVDNSKLSNIINNKDNLEKQTMKACNHSNNHNEDKISNIYCKF